MQVAHKIIVDAKSGVLPYVEVVDEFLLDVAISHH